MSRCVLALLLLAQSAGAAVFSVIPNHEPDRPRSLFLPPLASFFLPSFDQWFEQQQSAAGIYVTMAAGGLGLAGAARSAASTSGDRPLSEYRGNERQYTYGLQLYQLAGELSAFHSFRTAVESRRAQGQFAFLKTQEDPGDLLLAPFEFSWLARPTTFLPLLAILSAGVAQVSSSHHRFTFSDGAFTAGTSYNAGVGEEALFRGYLMPLARESWGNDFWSNTATAVVFGAAHYSRNNRLPVIQGLLGWYFGWLTQRNEWSLRQAIFIHTWWDICAIGFTIAADNKQETFVPLPGFTYSF